MSKGTTSGLLDDPQAQSVFKHAILTSYIIPFAVMTASKVAGRRAVLVDGFAGRGRYEDGQPASAELLLQAAENAPNSTNVEVFLAERSKKLFQKLSSVADEYQKRGVRATAYHGEIQDYVREVLHRASDAPLFLFLDPCGANLPFETLATTLGATRGRPWPRTEALLNISADLTRRAAGAIHKGMSEHDSVPVMDAVCGGSWWQQTALDAREASPRDDWESAAEAVVAEYARRLGKAARMKTVIAPVRRQAHHQPVYHLVYLTRGEHGIWVFGDALAKARIEWLKFIGTDEEQASNMLFNLTEDQIGSEADRAVQILESNLRNLATRGTRLKLVDYTLDVFGEVYGFARETSVRAAMRKLQKSDAVSVDTSAKQVRDWTVG